jgi:hypothetical protein
MNKVLSTSLLAITCTAAFTAPALAGNSNGMVNTKQLPQTTFHKSRIQAQVVDETPIITNCVRPEQKAKGIRIVGSGQAGPTQIDANDGGGLDGMQVGNPTFSRSNPMVNTAGVPQSGFGSNIPAGGPGIPGGRNLQPGTTSNRLLGVNGQLRTAPHGQPAMTGSAPRAMAAPAPATTAATTYPTYPSGSGNAAGGTQVKTNVVGSLRSHHLSKTGH